MSDLRQRLAQQRNEWLVEDAVMTSEDAAAALAEILEVARPEAMPLNWTRDAVVDAITSVDYWGARSRPASKGTAERIVKMLEDEGLLLPYGAGLTNG